MKRGVVAEVAVPACLSWCCILGGCGGASEREAGSEGAGSSTGMLTSSTTSEPDPSAEDTGMLETGSEEATAASLTGDESSEGSSGEPDALGEPHGRLVIDEVYFTGAQPFGDVDHYFSDQFIALRNISDVPVATGGLMIADVFGVAGEINPGIEPNALTDDTEHVYLSSVWMIPGAPDDVVLAPGARMVIAQDGTNHAPFSTVDLSGVDFETFVADSEQDDDYPTVENLELLHYNAGFDWLIPVFGPSVVIVDTTEALQTHVHEGQTLVAAPVSAVVDGVDIVMDAESGPYKRLPSTVDAGFTFATGTYTGEAVRRRREDGQSVDTDDSSVDFELTMAPDPYGDGLEE